MPADAPRPGLWSTDPTSGATLVDLYEVDAESGAEVLAVVNALRAAGRRGQRVIVHGCPHFVAHTLYKIGALGEGWLDLVDPREEEPYG